MPTILCDLDGTLAHYHGTLNTIGDPIPEMYMRVKKWLEQGYNVKVFTARASVPELIPPIREWLDKHDLMEVGITNSKDFDVIEIWDDRAIEVVHNLGIPRTQITDRRL